MDKEQIELLEEFVDLCQIKPSVLHRDELKFFKDWLLSMGATIPEDKSSDERDSPMAEEEAPAKDEEESEESDLDISMEGVIEGDEISEDQFIGDESVEVTEENQDKADEKRDEALEHFRQGDYAEAVRLFTEAIKLNPCHTMLYAKRASCYVKLKRPNAAIKDAEKSISMNPDSAQAYKWRGLSYKLLGKWEQAFDDLTLSLKLDYADDTYEQMKELEPKAKLIRDHKRKYERKREEKKLKERQERVRRAQEEHEKAKKASSHQHQHSPKYSDMGAGFPGMGSMPTGLGDLLNDPELVEDMKDPEVMRALSDIINNPANLLKYSDNPKIANIINKMQTKFGGGCEPMDHHDCPPPKAPAADADDLD